MATANKYFEAVLEVFDHRTTNELRHEISNNVAL